jgi:hypothetical protein
VYTHAYKAQEQGNIRTQTETDRVQNIGDAAAGTGDPRYDSCHSTACLHYLQLSITQQVEGEDATEGGGAHLRLRIQFKSILAVTRGGITW